MRTLCDACESAPAILFCPADEAALCRACDEKVHTCNKLASRHVRVGLANPVDVPRCDICENAHAFFYCEIDGIALCLECDTIVHVEGKRFHARYLLLRQKVKFPEEPDIFEVPAASQTMVQAEIRRPQIPPQLPLTLRQGDNQQNRRVSPVRMEEPNSDVHARMAIPMIDLNRKPRQLPEQTSSNKYIDESGSMHGRRRDP